MILENIRSRTHSSHKKLEESSLMSPITSRTVTRDEYIKILQKFYGYFNPLEKEINKHTAILSYLPDYPERRKSENLLSDLTLFGQFENVPVCKDLPEIPNLSAAFGCLYVMEGSTLGGRIITKLLSDTLGISSDTGASFFNGYGQETGTKWKKFQEALIRYTNFSKDDEQIIESAEKTFLKFYNWVTVS